MTSNSAPKQAQVASPPTQTATYVDERYLSARLEAVEARSDVKFAQLLGELKVISASVANQTSKLGNIELEMAGLKTATATVKWNIVATGLVLGGLIVAIAAFGAQILGLAASLVGI